MAAVASSSTDGAIVRLSYKEKVPVTTMKEIITIALSEKLQGATYDSDKSPETARALADVIRSRLSSLPFERYKYIVTVVIGERREQGVRVGSRCFWDVGTDNQARETFLNDNIFCTATAFAVYLY